MTPAQLTGLALLLLEFKVWVRDYGPDAPLDVELIDHVIDVCDIYRRMLVQDGAR